MAQKKLIAYADSVKKECDLRDNSIAVFMRKSVVIELHTLPSYAVEHFSLRGYAANSHTHACCFTAFLRHPTAP